jgi:hypothetical protein
LFQSNHFRLIFNHSTVTEKKGHDIMLLLVPPGADPLPTLGDEVMPGGNVHVMKKFRVFTVPTISALTHCCSVMLTSYYPVQVLSESEHFCLLPNAHNLLV